MHINIFLDTNILYRDYTLQNRQLKDLEEWFDFQEISYSLCIAEIVYHELLKQLDKDIEDAKNSIRKVNKNIKKFNIDFTNHDAMASYFKCFRINYIESLNEKFSIISATDKAHRKAYQRYYDKKSPFKNDKLEFKDSLIWETLEESHCEDEEISFTWLVSNDKSAFFDPQLNGLNKDFNNHKESIMYFGGIKQLLDDQEILLEDLNTYLKSEDQEYIFKKVSNLIQIYDFQDSHVIDLLEDYLLTGTFEGDSGFEGWGINPFVNNIELYSLNIEEGSRSPKSLYIPIILSISFSFDLEYKSPMYDRFAPDDEEFINIGSVIEEREISCEIIYDLEKEEIVDVYNRELI